MVDTRCPEFMLVCLVLLLSGAAGSGQAADLSTESLSISIRGGSVVSLTNRLTGERLVGPPKDTWASELHALDGRGFAMSSADRLDTRKGAAFVEQSASRPAEDGKPGASLATRVERDSATGDLIVTQEGRADAKGVYGVSWGVGDIPDTLSVLVPGTSGQRFGSDAPAGTRTFEYPMGWEAPFVIIQGEKGGVIVWAEDPDYHFKVLTVEHAGKSFRLRFETRNFAPFEEKDEARSVEWRITAYRGPWQKGAAVYREWATKAYHLTPLEKQRPAWVKHIQFVVIMRMEIPALDALAKRVKPEQTLLYVPSWRKDGYDRNYPDYTALPEFGPFVEQAHRLGFKVMPHVNYFGCDPKNPLHETFSKWQLRDPFSKALQWWDWKRADPPIKFAYINPASREWRKLFVSRMKELCEKYDIDALHLDQTLVIINDANGPIDGMSCVEGNIALHRELREALPHVALSGEGLNEATCRYEAFAQRHVWGINHADGTWSGRALGMAHPVSSAILLPHTRMYGYLGLPNAQQSPGLYMAWRRAYEYFGVIPTLAWPSQKQLADPPALVSLLLKEARFFQRWNPTADFDSLWGEGDLFLYRLSDGRRAFHMRDQGIVFGVRGTDGKTTVISRRIEGLTEVKLPGSLPGWPAYDASRIFGLDPSRTYLWSPRPRRLKEFHISSLPEGFVLTQAGIHPRFARFRFQDLRTETRLWDFPGDAECGVQLSDGGTRRHRGFTFSDPSSGGNVYVEDEGLFAHPPWKREGDAAPSEGIGLTFIEYRLQLPQSGEISFESDVCLKPDAVGRSDGVTFRVWATCDGETLSAETHHAGSEPKPLRLDLSAFRGGTVLLRLESDPGPAGSAEFDWARFARPSVVVCAARRRSIEIVADRPVERALATEGAVAVKPLSGRTCRLELTMPNTLILPFGEALPVTPPFDLLHVPFANHMLPSNGLEGPPVQYSKASVGEATCANEERLALNEHPPNDGKTLVDYWLKLPDEPVRLLTAIGVRDGSQSNGVGFEVEVNGKRVFQEALHPDSGWVPVEVDLAPWAGRSIMLTLITDSLGDHGFDWAVWAAPRLLR